VAILGIPEFQGGKSGGAKRKGESVTKFISSQGREKPKTAKRGGGNRTSRTREKERKKEFGRSFTGAKRTITTFFNILLSRRQDLR